MTSSSLADSTHSMSVLLLGPRGVGKTTWINAALNYCKHASLEEALKANSVAYATPSIFSARAVERGSPVPVRISIGFDNDEVTNNSSDTYEKLEPTGTQSYPQKTTVHCFRLGSSAIRFIDAPGIGNPGDAEQDDDLFPEIMQTLSHYGQLHGIVIFVESTWVDLRSKLDLHSVLSHLHLNMADNIVFGFTKTSKTSYLSGRTFSPLQSWLGEYPHSGLQLTGERAFCFDSEGFRYLVASRQGHELGGRADAAYSWTHSSAEMRRMIDYFASVRPHQLAETTDLAYTRRVLPVLAKAVIESSVAMRTAAANLEEAIQGVMETQRTVRDLRKRLKVQKTFLQPEALDKPRTVCKHWDCVGFVDDGSGDGTVLPSYRSHCHDPCFDIGPVQLDTVGHPGLLDCEAFKQGETCVKCGHHWQEHLHVLSHLVETTSEVVETQVERQLALAENDLKLRERGVNELQGRNQEWIGEFNLLGTVESQLRTFLGRHSFMTGSPETTRVQEVLSKYPEPLNFTSSMTSMKSGTNGGGYTSSLRSNWEDMGNEKKLEMLVTPLFKLKIVGPLLSAQLTENDPMLSVVCEKVHHI